MIYKLISFRVISFHPALYIMVNTDRKQLGFFLEHGRNVNVNCPHSQ